MFNLNQHYSEVADYFGDSAFEALYLEAISNLSSEALSRLQALVEQAIAQKVKEKS
ncbi:hypothetical protein HW132_28310 [Brasilonema sp. CT11]|nr:hypothetical protein [Brasilonema sp. CT11]